MGYVYANHREIHTENREFAELLNLYFKFHPSSIHWLIRTTRNQQGSHLHLFLIIQKYIHIFGENVGQIHFIKNTKKHALLFIEYFYNLLKC